MVFAVYEFYICIVHLTFWGFMSSCKDNFILLNHSEQVDGTEEKVLHSKPHQHLQAQYGFLTSNPNGVRTCSDRALEDHFFRYTYIINI